jgi:hypothetical protein
MQLKHIESEMIEIEKSQTADTRSCDFTKVTKETLLASSRQHIADVEKSMMWFALLLSRAARKHDYDKLTGIDHFYSDFQTGFKEQGWLDHHRQINRHHLDKPEGIPDDVNLLDVLEMIADFTMAGMARTGNVFPITLPPAVLTKALENTAKLLKRNVKVVE